MKLSNLDILSTMRLTQPEGADANQVLDIEFSLTNNAVISNDFLALAFYEMMNGYVTGKDGGSSVTGIKFAAYDQTNVMIMESEPVKIDKIVDEVNTKLSVLSETILVDSSVDKYVAKVTVSFVSNNMGTDEEFLIFTSTAPATTKFAEVVGAGPLKGVQLEAGMSTKFTGSFTLSWKN
jgi:hypothetical protein